MAENLGEHKKEYKTKPKSTLADVILGGQDGLVNVLGVILGVAAASDSIKIVLAGGLAATFAESISMAAVALTSKMAARDHFLAQFEKEKKELKETPEKEEAEIRAVFAKKGFKGETLDKVVDQIISDEELWINTMIKEELQIEAVEQKEIYRSSWVVGGSALVGSFIPLIPYFFFPIHTALIWSLIVSAIALILVGIYKAKATIGSPSKSAIQMLVIGMGAALAGYIIGLLFSKL